MPHPVRDSQRPPAHGLLRLLVIDDEPMILRAYHRVLSEIEMTGCDNAAAALERIAGGERFDVILCDVVMPDLNGPAFYRALQEIAPRQVDGLVFCSGGVLSASIQQFLADTPNPVLTKPIPVDVLRGLVGLTA